MTAHHKLLTNLILEGIFILLLLGCSKKEEDPPAPGPTIPVLTTAGVTGIGQISAISGGTITSDGGASVTLRGVCWSQSPNPAINGSHTTDGTGTGTFSSQIISLAPNTVYYVRAFATNSIGTGYGDTLSFKTLPPDIIPPSPVVTTAAITDISQTTATSGGTLISEGGSPVTRCGICWGLATNPQITGAHTTDSLGTGTFISLMMGLTPDTLYYVRAYVTNSYETAYGDVQSFRTLKVAADTVTDVDGNIYHFVPIGGKLWIRENLRVKHYLNGEEIPQVTDANQWKFLTTGAYCTYDNLASNGLTYGNLYNWHAVSDPRGICPSGWHVPADTEWTELGDSLGGAGVAGGKLKSTGTLESGTGFWYFPNTDATNSSGFTGLPGGYRINYGTYYSMGNVAYFWSSTQDNVDKAWLFILDANNGELNSNFDFKTNGFSVRCCKD